MSVRADRIVRLEPVICRECPAGRQDQTWVRGRWAATQEEADAERREFFEQSPNGGIGNPLWRWGEQPRTCSGCGGVHPEDAIALLKSGFRAMGTDKGYKWYLEPPVPSDASHVDLIPPAKLYAWRADSDQRTRLIAAANGA